MLSSTENVCEELIHKKAALLAEMAEIDKREKETMRKEAEVAHNAEAAWLAVEKAAKKAAKKGKKRAVEELGTDVGAKGSKPKKRVKTTKAGDDNKSPLETAEVSCER